MLDKGANPGRHALKARKDDLYETPDVAVHALLRAGEVPAVVWEPACGPGAIVRVLRSKGRHVVAQDLVDYGCPGAASRIDFLMEQSAPPGCECIITNPPFKLAAQFVERGLMLVPKVVVLLRLAFLEGTGRSNILDSGHLARVHVFRERLPMMHRGGWQGNESGNSIAFAWMVWDRAHVGPATLHRISWKTEL